MRKRFKNIVLSKQSIALLTSFVAISKVISTASALNTDALVVNNTNEDKITSNINTIGIDTSEYQKKVISESDGIPTLTEVLGAILEDARGPCLGAVRCAIALTDNELLTLEDRFDALGLETDKVGNYAISISGNMGKARALAIIENKEDSSYYTKYILNNFVEYKKSEMISKGLYTEARIAENAIVKEIGNYTVIAMNPHAKESIRVIEDGLNRLEK